MVPEYVFVDNSVVLQCQKTGHTCRCTEFHKQSERLNYRSYPA